MTTVLFYLKTLLSPFVMAILLCLLAWLLIRKKPRLGFLLLTAGLAWMLIWSNPAIVKILVKPLESKYAALQPELLDKEQVKQYNILVLGGGHAEDDRYPAIDQLVLESLGRLSEGVRIARIVPVGDFVVSGFSFKGEKSHAEILSNAALSLGVPDSLIRLLPEPENTYQEAEAYFADFHKADRPLILVTSAIHMPRAVRMFELFGIPVIPAPTNHFYKDLSWNGIPVFSPKAVSISHYAFKEYIGMAVSGLRYNTEPGQKK